MVIFLAVTIWNSAVAWLFIGIFLLIEWVATGSASLAVFHFVWWGIVLLLGYAQLLKDFE